MKMPRIKILYTDWLHGYRRKFGCDNFSTNGQV